ncbi:MAG: EAL and HDOD domain-containing protein [Saccharospirillum sp.]
MAQFFLARQPIYNRELTVIGYELLYRNSDVNKANISDPDRASSDVILNTFIHIGVDVLAGSSLVFINLPKNFIVNDAMIPMFSQQCVLEILEDVEATQEVLQGLERLSRQGFKLALDDFELTEKTRPLLHWAHYVKIDVLGKSRDDLSALLAELRVYPVKLIAEKVETPEMKEVCEALGFDYFQGYFYCRPQLMIRKGAEASKVVALELFNKLQQPGSSFEELEQLLAQDVNLSYKLLRYINSAAFTLRREVDSIKDAIIILGIENIKHWAMLILMTQMDDSKPRELITTALIRGRMCEQIAAQWYPEVRHQMFIVGLFSVLDALMNQPLTELLGAITLTNSVKLALLEKKGIAGSVYRLVLAYERMDFPVLEQASLTEGDCATIYLEAVTWAEQRIGTL